MLVVLSPKLQNQLSSSNNPFEDDKSVKSIFSGAIPSVGVAIKSAIGGEESLVGIILSRIEPVAL